MMLEMVIDSYSKQPLYFKGLKVLDMEEKAKTWRFFFFFFLEIGYDILKHKTWYVNKHYHFFA